MTRLSMATTVKIKTMFTLLKRSHSFRAADRQLSDTILDLFVKKPIGTTQIVKGWAKSVRKMKGLVFVDVNDGSCSEQLQVVIPKELNSKFLTYGSCFNAVGKLQATPKGQLELFAEKIEVIGPCDVTDDYPFTPKQKHSPDYCRQYLHLRPKTKHFSSLLRVRHVATKSVHDFFHERGFLAIHTPILTANDCEGAGEVFKVQPANENILNEMRTEGVPRELSYFNSPAYLTVSGQLHLEAISRSIGRVYTFNPTFRAENSKSRLHLSEFYMIESEESFVSDLGEVLTTMEDFIKSIISTVVAQCRDDLKLIVEYHDTDVTKHLESLEAILNKPFAVMTFEEAVKEVEGNGLGSVQEGFNKEQELFLVGRNDGTPVFVVDWPSSMKPFYMKNDEQNPSMVRAVDLLVPNVGELCGGSLREDNYERLQQKLVKLNLQDSMAWYLELRKFGNVPTGGFGMGFERFLQFVLNIGNIKDTIPFPRWPHSLQM